MKRVPTLSAITLTALLLAPPPTLYGADSPTAAAKRPEKPHPPIILIVADDMGYGDLSCYGNSTPTPHIDSLARDGVRFTRFYANAPECTPTRTALFTGRYQQRVGGMECALGTGNVGRYDDAIRLRETHDLGLPAGENTLVAGLKKAGYRTVLSGKWHLGYEPTFSPVAHGFDYAFGPIGGGVDYFHHTEWDGSPALFENGQAVKRDGYMTDLITEVAVQAIQRADHQPLFLYAAYTAPHAPIQGPGDFQPQALREPVWNDGTPQKYAAMIRSLDHGVGRILQAIADRGWKDDALVIFMSDNGGTKLARNEPFSGTKGTLYEGGIRVPCIVRWPDRLPRSVVTEQAALTLDFTRSILRIADVPPGPNRILDGVDILQLLEHQSPLQPRTLFWRYRRADTTWRAVIDGHLKLIHRQEGSNLQEEMFDLAVDPQEKRNLASHSPEARQRLDALLAQWQEDIKSSRPEKPRTLPTAGNSE